MRLYRNLSFSLFCVVFLSVFPPLRAEEKILLLKSSVRIIEGVVAADWEQRFLTLEQPDVAPDHDVPHSNFSPIAPLKEKHSQHSQHSHPHPLRSVPKEPRAKNDIPIEKRLPQAQKFEASPPAMSPHFNEETERVKPPSPVTPAPSSPPSPKPSPSPRFPKVDKAGEADDDNAEKRKKERREILREERKEREYRNRRIE